MGSTLLETHRVEKKKSSKTEGDIHEEEDQNKV